MGVEKQHMGLLGQVTAGAVWLWGHQLPDCGPDRVAWSQGFLIGEEASGSG